MAFHSLMLQLVAELRPLLPSSPTVLEFGNQTFKPRVGDLDRLRSTLQTQRVGFDASLLDALATRSGEALDGSTADFYRALGFARYRAIDVNGRYDSLVMDLNRDIVAQYGFSETFDLVTNNGTSEHVFNQAAVFANAHALCAPRGVMLHVLPFFNYLNHGFFNYNPILFHDLAAANGYEICRLSIASNRGLEAGGPNPTNVLSRDDIQARCAVDGSVKGSLSHLLRLGKRGKVGNRPLSVALRRVMSAGPNVGVVAALRKTRDAAFQFPIQGMYGGSNIDDAELRAAYTSAQKDAS